MNTPLPDIANNSRRTRLMLIAAAAFAAVGIAYGLYWALVLRYSESTDDAYVSGNVVQITPQIAGTVVAIGADDTQLVRTGSTLVQLDPADARVALEQAEAHLANTVRTVRGLFATSSQLAAATRVRASDLATAEQDLARRERLASSGAISAEELQHARDGVTGARAALLSAEQQLAANAARVDGTTISDHPEVRDAAAAVHSAFLTYARTRLPAPVTGYVARRNVQLGQRVGPGAVLMAVVPLQQVWVDANFKELQIAAMRVGQPVTLTADLYGAGVRYHGRVAGFSAGTGASFALLPAQNATGNWIKVVQRVPVRIELDPRELDAHPLQIGLSMRVAVSTRDQSGPRLPQVASTATAYRTDVFDAVDRDADARVAAIIAANLTANTAARGKAVRRGGARPAPAGAAPGSPPLAGTIRAAGQDLAGGP